MKKIKLRVSVKKNKQIASYSKAVKSGSKIQHVIPKDGNWAVKSTSSNKVTKVFTNQREAINYGKNIAKNQKTDLIVHSRQGKIRDRKYYK